MKPHKTESNFVAFMYELLRDHLPASTVETVVRNSEKKDCWSLSNGYLAEYAEELVRRLK